MEGVPSCSNDKVTPLFAFTDPEWRVGQARERYPGGMALLKSNKQRTWLEFTFNMRREQIILKKSFQEPSIHSLPHNRPFTRHSPQRHRLR